jgi:hypothetical protein
MEAVEASNFEKINRLRTKVTAETSNARTRMPPALDDAASPSSPTMSTATPPAIGSQIKMLNI